MKIARGIDSADRERPPGALRERVHDRETQAGERDDDDEEDRDRGGGARDRSDFGARDLGQRAAASPGRRPQDDQIVNGAGEADAADQPDQPWRVAELRRQHRTDERTRPGDRGEMVTEEHPPGRRVVVVPVGAGVRRRDPRVVEDQDARGDERAVIAVCEHQNPENRENHVQRSHAGDSRSKEPGTEGSRTERSRPEADPRPPIIEPRTSPTAV